MSLERVDVDSIVAPTDEAVPSEMIPLSAARDKRDCLVLSIRPNEPPPNLSVLAGHPRYWTARRAGHQNVEALVRRLDDDVEIRLKEHYAIGGLSMIEELDALDELSQQRGISRVDLAQSLGAKRFQTPPDGPGDKP